MKPDELAFLLKLAAERPRQQLRGPFADEIGVGIGIPPKRASYILEKWSKKGWWESGVSTRSGWLTEKGLIKATEAMADVIAEAKAREKETDGVQPR